MNGQDFKRAIKQAFSDERFLLVYTAVLVTIATALAVLDQLSVI